jgi:hypothetical protein
LSDSAHLKIFYSIELYCSFWPLWILKHSNKQ